MVLATLTNERRRIDLAAAVGPAPAPAPEGGGTPRPSCWSTRVRGLSLAGEAAMDMEARLAVETGGTLYVSSHSLSRPITS